MDIREYVKRIKEVAQELMDADLFTENELANNVLIVGVLAEMRKDERGASMKTDREKKKQELKAPMTENQKWYLDTNKIPYDGTWGFDTAFEAIGKHKKAHGGL